MTFNDALALLKQHLEAGLNKEAWAAVRLALMAPYSLMQLQKLNALAARHEAEFLSLFGGRTLRVAVLGTYTTQPVCQAVMAAVLAEEHWPVIYEAGYDCLEAETLDPNSGLYTFKPDVVLIVTSSLALKTLPRPGMSEAQVQELADRELAGLQARWRAIAMHCQARIIQHNFDPPASLPAGRLEARYPWTASRYVERVNQHLWEHDGREVRILDAHRLSQDQGRRHWFDARWYHHSKHGFAFSLIRQYQIALSSLLRGMLGRTHKCLVVDLDNTLWGGVIGDDGIDGIRMGNNSAEGEAFAAFGRYLKSLQALGVLLAINSKNNESVAMEVFEKHPEMPLKRADFAAVRCNWQPKSGNLREIAAELNIGIDSLVFIDDNPAECAEVRAALPEVLVVEMQGDPASFPRQIEDLQLFTPLDFTAEDATRTKSYAAREALASASGSPATLESHLRNLNMEAAVRPAAAADLVRIEQLFRKTNQFNLTGRTYEQSALQDAARAGDQALLAAWLSDVHASHGLVSVVLARIDGDRLDIDNWVMSCRVFSRTFEEYILGCLLDLAALRGCTVITVRFVHTTKNSYARSALERLGFQSTSTSADGAAEHLTRDVCAAGRPVTLIRAAAPNSAPS